MELDALIAQRRKHQGLIACQLNSQKREGRSFIQHDAINACIEEKEAVGYTVTWSLKVIGVGF